MKEFWNIFSSIITIISTFIAIFEIVKYFFDRYFLSYIPFVGKCFSWRQINNMVTKVCGKINESPDRFGSIVGIGRGGAIFASLMSYQLDAIPVFVFDRQYAIVNGERTVISLVDDIKFKDEYKDLLKKPVLLVSQRADPGITISTYVEVLKKIGFENIVVCAILVSKENSYVDIRYYYKKYSANTKIKIFPWIYKKPNIMLDDRYIKN